MFKILLSLTFLWINPAAAQVVRGDDPVNKRVNTAALGFAVAASTWQIYSNFGGI